MWRAALASLALAATVVCSAAGQNLPTGEKGGQVVLRWLGTAGWEISDGKTVMLIDPYVSRIFGPQPPGRAPYERAAGDTRPLYGWDDAAVPDASSIDAHVQRADFVFVTHTHYDHVLDVPQIALKTHAVVLGTESTANVLRAYKVPEEQLITVRGGEDYEFGAFSVKVIPSLHSPLDRKHYFSSEKAPEGMKAPLTLRQMHPEGGTLGYLIRFHGHQILVFGGMNYIEREIQGLEPDVVLVGAASSRKEIYDYSGRLMRALHFPALVLPTHWDNFTAPYGASQQPSIDTLQSFIEEIKAASPKTKVITPKHFEAIPLPSVLAQ
jgi:L-ascorbate metabolism protein UlaG (beta-lactamase superfamily)